MCVWFVKGWAQSFILYYVWLLMHKTNNFVLSAVWYINVLDKIIQNLL